MKTKNLDQYEAQTLRDQLLLRSRALTAALETAVGKKVEEPKLSMSRADNLFADIDLLESHCELLQREISAACKPQTVAPTTPAPTPASTVAAPAPAQTEAKKSPAFNPDAKILAARGVKTVDELNAKGPTGFAKQD
jgi:hypothetical protein